MIPHPIEHIGHRFRHWHLACLFRRLCQETKATEQLPPPEWIGQRPLSSSHYIGIGSATQTPVAGDALANAKKRAAADLAS